ncbi:MAG: ATP-grasp fold amidoligase family protein [Methylovirgula sp.]|nr:ATP-grasp fold amidoligase family protein [Methylovirgula sp.]
MAVKDAIRPRLPAWAHAIWQHWEYHGEFPNLLRPKTFCDKILHRILFERDERLTETTDKLRARAFVERRLGADILPKLLYVTDDPATIPFDDLPPRFIVKPTHGSGWFKVVHDKARLDRTALIATCRDWLARSFYAYHREWAYKNVVRRILVQELIDDGTGPLPLDYRVYVFGGKATFIIVDKMENGVACSGFFDLGWRRLDISNGLPEISGEVPRPKHFDEMIRAAEILAEDTGFVRVDFFDTDAQLYFVEMTWTPNAGFKRFHPPVYERRFGDLWTKPGAGAARSFRPMA